MNDDALLHIGHAIGLVVGVSIVVVALTVAILAGSWGSVSGRSVGIRVAAWSLALGLAAAGVAAASWAIGDLCPVEHPELRPTR